MEKNRIIMRRLFTPSIIVVIVTNIIFSLFITTNNIVRITTTADEQSQNLVRIPLIPHHVQEERRRRQRRRRLNEQQEASPPLQERSSPLYQGKGTHYVDLWIGTPPQRQTVIVDTGSAITAFPCGGRVDHGSPNYHIDGYFLGNQSSTFREDVSCEECVFGSCGNAREAVVEENGNEPPPSAVIESNDRCVKTIKYAEGSSWTGHEVTDMVSIGGSTHEAPSEDISTGANSAFMLRFGCQTHLTGLFITQMEDGIMGMDKGSASSTFWKQAYDQKVISNHAFSLCYSHPPFATVLDKKGGTGAGVMTLGGTDTTLHETTMVYADQIIGNDHISSTHYTVRIKKMYIRSYHAGTSVEANYKNATAADVIIHAMPIDEDTLNGVDIIVDSGTTSTHFPKGLEEPFKLAYKTATNTDWIPSGERVLLTPEQVQSMPTILIQLDGGDHNKSPPQQQNNQIPQGLATNVDANNPPNDIVIAVPPSHYMHYSNVDMTYTTSIKFDALFLGLFGANFMMGHDILFDNDNHRIGFAESNCEYRALAQNLETAGG